MLFNSLDFAVFFPLVFIVHWLLPGKSLRLQNVWILFSSYLFYSFWDYRFLALILLSTLCDYLIANKLRDSSEESIRKLLLFSSLAVNLGLLGFFKYFNFFVESFSSSFTLLGLSLEAERLEIVLPVGISFYTFQTLSYTIDVYRKKIQPTRDFVSFASFVSFFPQLVAGPIERAKNLLPQFEQQRTFNLEQGRAGLRLILWGLFKKVVVADNCAVFVNQLFDNPSSFNSIELIIGAVLFSFQIYCDFSGYSDVAIGSARLLGIKLQRNFAYPYFATNIVEFWRRWHISLTDWFRDYLYYPLGGNRVSSAKWLRNVFLVFLVSGLWHGANWTFVVWGLMHALVYVLFVKFELAGKQSGFLAGLSTFFFVTLCWVVFRAESLSAAIEYYACMFSRTKGLGEWSLNTVYLANTSLVVVCLLFLERLGREQDNVLESVAEKLPRPFSILINYMLLLAILSLAGPSEQFIYFQF